MILHTAQASVHFAVSRRVARFAVTTLHYGHMHDFHDFARFSRLSCENRENHVIFSKNLRKLRALALRELEAASGS